MSRTGVAMPDWDRFEYYERREAVERAAAARCTDPAIARVHLSLAERYADALVKVRACQGPPVHTVKSDRHA
ncbi:hypothetical protein M0208_06370 [Sphingomonas sp. SUN019]|uniref:hypothetical protein n=1 Tax=Sphingomonas sp. SUN019 TaxID=2937788 RepID=UPI0021647294|nr:hypothetical protein [Sphingomonas sp. SUN019]UVO50161.1 hypothetical protein M0208_06370 [Sphingomonas sp. SUN019]